MRGGLETIEGKEKKIGVEGNDRNSTYVSYDKKRIHEELPKKVYEMCKDRPTDSEDTMDVYNNDVRRAKIIACCKLRKSTNIHPPIKDAAMCM